MKGYDKFPFEERKIYEETFVENNSALIEELTGASRVFDISQTPMDKRSGVDFISFKAYRRNSCTPHKSIWLA